MFVCRPQKQEEGDRPSRTRVTDGYEQPRCWESEPGPLEGQPVFIATESVSQSLLITCFKSPVISQKRRATNRPSRSLECDGSYQLPFLPCLWPYMPVCSEVKAFVSRGCPPTSLNLLFAEKALAECCLCSYFVCILIIIIFPQWGTSDQRVSYLFLMLWLCQIIVIGSEMLTFIAPIPDTTHCPPLFNFFKKLSWFYEMFMFTMNYENLNFVRFNNKMEDTTLASLRGHPELTNGRNVTI